MTIVNREIMKSEKKTRPSKTGEPVLVRLQPEPLARLDAWLRQQDDVITRAEAIRRLVEAALEAEKKRGRK